MKRAQIATDVARKESAAPHVVRSAHRRAADATGGLVNRSSARTMTADTVVPSAFARSCAARHSSSGTRTVRSGCLVTDDPMRREHERALRPAVVLGQRAAQSPDRLPSHHLGTGEREPVEYPHFDLMVLPVDCRADPGHRCRHAIGIYPGVYPSQARCPHTSLVHLDNQRAGLAVKETHN